MLIIVFHQRSQPVASSHSATCLDDERLESGGEAAESSSSVGTTIVIMMIPPKVFLESSFLSCCFWDFVSMYLCPRHNCPSREASAEKLLSPKLVSDWREANFNVFINIVKLKKFFSSDKRDLNAKGKTFGSDGTISVLRLPRSSPAAGAAHNFDNFYGSVPFVCPFLSRKIYFWLDGWVFRG